MEQARIEGADKSSHQLFVPSPRAAVVIAAFGLAALSAALFLRYEIIENTPLGLACEAGRQSLTCTVRLAVIVMFTQSVFGWIAMIAAAIQVWRPNVITFCVGLVAALFGLVLYNTSASALAFALLLLSLARPVSEGRSGRAQ
jgi:hypothetical protein